MFFFLHLNLSIKMEHKLNKTAKYDIRLVTEMYLKKLQFPSNS
jgi:hypothetical protein